MDAPIRAFFMQIDEKRDFREETHLNAAEWQMLRSIAGRYGVSKSAALRLCLHIVGDKITRDELMKDTDEKTGF